MLEGPSKWGMRVKLVSAENLLYAAIFTLSFAVSLYFLLPVWFPFLALAHECRELRGCGSQPYHPRSPRCQALLRRKVS